MRRKLIIEGNAVYEVDEECMLRKCLSEHRQNPAQKAADPKRSAGTGNRREEN